MQGPWLVDEAGSKMILRGVAYGPFKPNSHGEPWPEGSQLHADLAHIRELGFNAVRIYEPPSQEMLLGCEACGLYLLCGIPWTQHVDFIADRSAREDALAHVSREARRLALEPCVAALLVGNEIEKTLVRWMRPKRVLHFLEELIATAKQAAHGKLVSYASYPSTEYLLPRNADFVACNVFLEERGAFARYLRRLQVRAAGRPLVITEFGLDSRLHGEASQRETFLWQREVCERASIAGNFWFSYTDEWHRGGEDVLDWEFGLTTQSRAPKAICRELAEKLHPGQPVHPPRISAVVCTRNGSATLRECLHALQRQSHANYEVLVIDDGSTDSTADIAREFPSVRYQHQKHGGLSAARNLGARLATGEIVAYTDDDCIPDEDWLANLSRAFDDPQCIAAGGPNPPPSPRTFVESVVAAAPGSPSEVLLNDEEAEHLPGCNLAIRRSALLAIGGFHEEFKAAGDDVDVCWRLQAHGGKLCFVPSAVVWHHRRATVGAYFRQQSGYGFAEALLIQHHPRRFAWAGGARWSGAIYGQGNAARANSGEIHFGRFGLAPFQCVYRSGTGGFDLWNWAAGLPWLMMTLLLCGMGIFFKPMLLPAALMSVCSMIAAWKLAAQAGVSSWRQRALLWMLCFMQPMVRDWARLRGMISLRAWPRGTLHWRLPRWPEAGSILPRIPLQRFRWTGTGSSTRLELLAALMKGASARQWIIRKSGDTDLWDLSVRGRGGRAIFIRTVTEYHGRGLTVTRLELSTHATPFFWLHWLSGDAADFSAFVDEAARQAGLNGEESISPESLPHFASPRLHPRRDPFEASQA